MDKKIETKSSLNDISSKMMDASSNLAENLAQSEPFLRFKAAEQKLHADRQAMQLLAELADTQQIVRARQSSGAILESDVARLRELQKAFGTNETIQEHEHAQELAIAFLRSVNQEITQLLGTDFASLARRSSGCC